MSAERDLYFKLSLFMDEHPKVVGLSDKAFRALVSLWLWTARNKTDGLIAPAIWRAKTTPKVAQELRGAGLVDDVDGDVWMHDYTKHQRSAERIAEISRKRSEAGSKGGRPRSKPKAGETNLVSPASQAAGVDRPDADQISESYDRSSESGQCAAAEASPQVTAVRSQGGRSNLLNKKNPEDRRQKTERDPAPSELALVPPPNVAPKPQTLNQRAQALARSYVNVVSMSNFPAVMGIAKKALNAGYEDTCIEAALLRLAQNGRSVTTDSLRIELDGRPAKPSASERAARTLAMVQTEPDGGVSWG